MKKLIKCLQVFSVLGFVSGNVMAAEKTRISRIVNESIVENITWSNISKIICYIAVAIIIISCVGYVVASAHKKQEIKKMVGTSLIISVLVLETSVISNMIRSSRYELGKLEEKFPTIQIELNDDIQQLTLDDEKID